MDFARFVHLLESQKLWFARTDQFEDPLEGTYTDKELSERQALLDLDKLANPRINVGKPTNSVSRKLSLALILAQEHIRENAYISCWRASPSESLAMWDLYGRGSGIVAVKSTVRALKRQIDRDRRRVYIAKVEYVEWSQWNSAANSIRFCARKDVSYEHEAELRAIMWVTPEALRDKSGASMPTGLEMSIDFGDLVTEVVVGPREKSWVVPLVRDVLRRYDLKTPVTSSNRLQRRSKLIPR